MMTLATDNGTILVFANTYDGAILAVIGETEKAINVRNKECGRCCWLPKAGLVARKPGVPTYENEYVLARWFVSKLNLQQSKVLNIAE